MDLPSAWLTAGSCNLLWGDPGTYGAVPIEFLPPVPAMARWFAWLRAAPKVKHGMSFEEQSSQTVAALLALHRRDCELRGLDLPEQFAHFLTDPTLFANIVSGTACYWDVGTRLIPLPGHDGPERLLRFMNDSQGSAYWFLFLSPHHPARVAFGSFDWGDNYLSKESIDDVATASGVTLCADSFESFLWRWWIENTIWFAAYERRPLEGDLRAYSEAARASGFRFHRT